MGCFFVSDASQFKCISCLYVDDQVPADLDMHRFKKKRVKNQEILQSDTADQPMAPSGRATEHRISQDIRKTGEAKQLDLSSGHTHLLFASER